MILMLSELYNFFHTTDGKIEFLDGRSPEPFIGKIIECSYNEKTDTWVFLRERVDKSTPNAYHVYEKVRSLQHNPLIILGEPCTVKN